MSDLVQTQMNMKTDRPAELVECRGLFKSYDGKKHAVDNVNLTLPRGKIIGLLGPNGSGKTTLIKMMNGLLAPSAGVIRINGCPVGPATKARVAYLPDRTYLRGTKRVDRVLEYFADFYSDFSKAKAEEMLKSLHIDPKATMNSLSKGTREKVQLILVMSRNADLYVLDEPIAGVDPAARDYILRTIINNYNPAATVLISTHLISDIEPVLDEVIFMRYGKLVLYTSVDNIREEKGKSVDAYFREVFAC
ncbi:MAG: ABC transporter ATP-binding protein [Clostridium sp.]|nr:ABC transporter ATP-binding protein [Acetatifactor muris]MCM1527082.1 ABC transporter ATP-binding protein [Bacteroides sp.]MCM1562058.1 ABC transporter ATP-binding protein [Clostridium sp.]